VPTAMAMPERKAEAGSRSGCNAQGRGPRSALQS
jgi:hypothetical protein